GEDAGGRAFGTLDEDGEAVRGDRPEGVPADLEMPARDIAAIGRPDAAAAEAAERDARPLAIVDHRADARAAAVGEGEPDGSRPGDVRDPRRVRWAGVLGGGAGRERRGLWQRGHGYFSTPVTTTPRMNARWARKNTTTGMAIVMRADIWMSLGCV